MKTFKEAFGFTGKVSPLKQSTRIGLRGIKDAITVLELIRDTTDIDPHMAKLIKTTLYDLVGNKIILDKIDKTGKY